VVTKAAILRPLSFNGCFNGSFTVTLTIPGRISTSNFIKDYLLKWLNAENKKNNVKLHHLSLYEDFYYQVHNKADIDWALIKPLPTYGNFYVKYKDYWVKVVKVAMHGNPKRIKCPKCSFTTKYKNAFQTRTCSCHREETVNEAGGRKGSAYYYCYDKHFTSVQLNAEIVESGWPDVETRLKEYESSQKAYVLCFYDFARVQVTPINSRETIEFSKIFPDQLNDICNVLDEKINAQGDSRLKSIAWLISCSNQPN
jgi:hypothetical protein